MTPRQPNAHLHQYAGDMPAPSLVFLCAFSVIILPFVRYPLGRQILRPGHAIPRTAVMLTLPLMLDVIPAIHRIPAYRFGYWHLVVFALLSLGLYLTRYLWCIFGNESSNVHSTECGYSFLVYTTSWPIFLTEMIMMPGAFVAAGYVIAQSMSLALGWWIMASGASLCLLAAYEAARRYEARRGAADGMIQAQTALNAAAPKSRKQRSDNVVDIADFG